MQTTIRMKFCKYHSLPVTELKALERLIICYSPSAIIKQARHEGGASQGDPKLDTIWLCSLCSTYCIASPEQAHEEEGHDENEVEKEGVLHEESFHRNPSMKLNHHARSRVQLAEETAIHIWQRLPLLQV